VSDTNAVAIRAAKESDLGVAPTTPNLFELDITGAPNLAFNPNTIVSEKIRADRQIDDLVLVGAEASGDINSEHAFEVHDLLLEGVFFNLFQTRFARTNTVVETQITDVLTATDTVTVTDESDQPVVDDIIRHEGFSNAGNNGFFTVLSSSAATDYVTNENLVDETPPAGATSYVVGRRSAAGDIDALTGPNSISSTILNFTTLGLEAGDWVKFAGFDGNPDNDDYCRIAFAGISANLLTFDIVPSGWGADAPAGAVDIYLGERLVNGSNRQSYFLEREYTDHSPVTFEYFLGMVIEGFTLTAAAQAIAQVSFTFSGLDQTFSDSGTPTAKFSVDGAGRITGATTVPAPSRQVLNTSSNVGRFARGGTPITGENFVLEASIEVANNLRQLIAVGFLGAVDIGVGEFGLTGSLNTYFDSAALARDVVSNTETSFDFRLEDDSAHVIIFDAPRIKFSEGSPEVPGKNDDVTINLGYQAIREPNLNYTAKYLRFRGVQ
jgi:hypothetical protein